MIALERYAHGTSAVVPEPRFAAFGSGIDAVVGAFYGVRRGGELGWTRRENAERFASEHLQGVESDSLGRIKNLLTSPSCFDRFKFYVDTGVRRISSISPQLRSATRSCPRVHQRRSSRNSD